MFCTQCGFRNPDPAQYCVNCGQPIAGPAAGPPPPFNAQTPYGFEPPAGKTSGMAIASLVCGFFAWILPAAVAAIILGHISRSAIRKSAGRLKGAGMAMTGLVFGYAGASLIPLMIVAAILIPNLLRARIVANEANALEAVRTIVTAQSSYSSMFPGTGYACELRSLGGGGGTPQAAGLIDATLSGGEKSGYRFTLRCVNDGYTVVARPVSRGSTGRRVFCADESAVIRSANKGQGQNCFLGSPVQ